MRARAARHLPRHLPGRCQRRHCQRLVLALSLLCAAAAVAAPCLNALHAGKHAGALPHAMSLMSIQLSLCMLLQFAVYHVTKDGWKKVSGTDVGELHFEYYAKPGDHPTWGTDPLGPNT